MSSEDLDRGIADYSAHLIEITTVFNDWAVRQGVHVRMDPTKIINGLRNGQGLVRVGRFVSKTDHSGIVHKEQLKTAIDCFNQLLTNPSTCGHVLGAMQSGKTTTSLALQWAGPVIYLLKGVRVYPYYLISNQTSHEDQTFSELTAFLEYYGDIEIHRASQGPSQVALSLDVVFERSPTLSTYREHVLTDTDDFFNVPQLGDLIYRRVGGDQGIRNVVERCRWATGRGYRPLMMIDEPQYGASSRIVDGENGRPERRPCVLEQIFDRIESELGTDRNDHWFVGLSATPFELNDLSRIWEVKQYLSESYSGFNFFNQEAIDEGVNIVPPEVVSQSDFADSIGVPFTARVSMAAYHSGPAAFARFARKIGFLGSQEQYRTAVDDALRETIYNVLDQYAHDGTPAVGLCIRALNNNLRTEQLISRLGLDTDRIEVLDYYGSDASGHSIKRIISQRTRKDLPYLILVTSRARMADAFPTDVRFFMDFGQKASDLNALLQGLLGRACGYGKRSRVVLSDQNNGIVEAYVATMGGYVHKTSRHSVVVGGYRRGAPTSMVKVKSTMDNLIVQQFFQEIDRQIVVPNIPNGSESPRNANRSRRNEARTGPVLTIAEALGMFDHIESPAIRIALFPQIPTGFKIARAGDEVPALRGDRMLRYFVDPTTGGCRYTFRWASREAGAQGGAAGRAMGQRDASGLSQHMEPTIYVEKFDPATGDVIYDRLEGGIQKVPGNWRAFMVTFPLKERVRELTAGEMALPTETSVYNDWTSDEEKEIRETSLIRR